MIKNKWVFFIFFVTIVVIIFFVTDLSLILKTKHKDYSEKIKNIPEREQKVVTFITEKMSGSELFVYTNYLDNENNNPEIASGHDILSESQGLLLLYLVNRDEKEYFDICFDWTIHNLRLDNGIFSWLKKSDHVECTNAFIDDSRVIRAFILAYEKWQDKRYLKYMNKTSEALLTYNIEADIPIDFYDHNNGSKSRKSTIAYLDLYTMKKLCDIDSRWIIPYENAYRLVKEAKIEGTGLYKFQYDLANCTYTEDDEISLIQSVYTMLHLAELGEYDTEGLDWLWHEYEKVGRIYSVYSTKNHEPVSDVESTALYALIARVYYLAGNTQKAEVFMEACEPYQILNSGSDIYGSFGNELNDEVYSFDNLQYLLASSMIYK